VDERYRQLPEREDNDADDAKALVRKSAFQRSNCPEINPQGLNFGNDGKSLPTEKFLVNFSRSHARMHAARPPGGGRWFRRHA
jgi:hypothetical protein